MTSKQADDFTPAELSKEVYEGVVTALCDALGVDADECVPAATLMDDLDVESIDFLDIVYRIEKRFDIEIHRPDLFPEDILSDRTYLRDGQGQRIGKYQEMPPDAVVMPAGIQALKRRMPWRCLDAFEQHPELSSFSDLLTVRDLCRFVEWQLDQTRMRR